MLKRRLIDDKDGSNARLVSLFASFGLARGALFWSGSSIQPHPSLLKLTRDPDKAVELTSDLSMPSSDASPQGPNSMLSASSGHWPFITRKSQFWVKITTGARWSVAGLTKASSGPAPELNFLAVLLRLELRFFSLAVNRDDLLPLAFARVRALVLECLASSSTYPSSPPEVVCCKKKDSNSSDPPLEEEDDELEDSSDPTDDSSSL
mmetsp:Transcript_3035/g.8762  ORF Transcript_3035/g.8762 Transcript_3035/m.8762 type:complete len:207 (-) Transcript_3035:2482-3102(-)